MSLKNKFSNVNKPHIVGGNGRAEVVAINTQSFIYSYLLYLFFSNPVLTFSRSWDFQITKKSLVWFLGIDWFSFACLELSSIFKNPVYQEMAWHLRSTYNLFSTHSVLERIWVKGSDLSKWLPQGERGPPKESKSQKIEILHVGSH